MPVEAVDKSVDNLRRETPAPARAAGPAARDGPKRRCFSYIYQNVTSVSYMSQ
jgi:hypothetical protein